MSSPPLPVPPQAPETGWAHRVLGDFHVTGLFWYRVHRWGVAILPDWAFAPVIAVCTAFFFVALVRIRRAIAANLEAPLGPCGFVERQRRIWRSLNAFAWCLSERYERLVTTRPFEVETEAIEHWRAVADGGRGVVMVTAHLGLYEAGSMIPATTEARRVHLIREPEVDPRAQAFMRDSVRGVESAHYTMHFQDGNPMLGVLLAEALDRGEMVAIQGDRPRAGGRTVPTTLFGRPFAVPAGPAALARTARVPLLPVFALRVGRRKFRLVFGAPIEVPRTRDRDADFAVASAAMVREIEAAIRRAPHQWFVFRTLWPRGDAGKPAS
jgi:lauroyl/myristoyl acyltransferase